MPEFWTKNSWIRWSSFVLLLGLSSGSVSAIFLHGLQWVEIGRKQLNWLGWLLPLAGLFIAWLYQQWGREAAAGNALLLPRFKRQEVGLPWIMAPLIVFSTWITHLFGGSAGREGTALQASASLADVWAEKFRFDADDRRIVLLAGISAGFAGVFGTPWAGTVFALELVRYQLPLTKRIQACCLVVAAAFLAHGVCLLWSVNHQHYPAMQWQNSPQHWLAVATIGITAAITGRFFMGLHAAFKKGFAFIKAPLWRPVIGGMLLWTLLLPEMQAFAGLGLTHLQASFYEVQFAGDFVLKTLFTTLTLAAGFKGGEVTPLFFIGAGLGNALFPFFTVDLVNMAALGFVAVFAAATKNPMACWVMGLELFGFSGILPLGAVCWLAFLLAGKNSLYPNQTAYPGIKDLFKSLFPQKQE